MTEYQDKLARVIGGLADRTTTGDLVWEQSQQWSDLFATNIGSTRVVVDSVDNDGVAPYRFQIRKRADHHTVHEIVMERDPENPSDVRMNELINKLYEAVRESVLQSESTLDEIIENLDI